MRLEQLYNIVEVYKTCSMSQASRNLYISQPSLSASIAALEEELGRKLFIRSSTGVTPTEYGEKIVAIIEEALLELEKIYQVAPHSAKSPQTINLLTIPAISNTLLPKTIACFKKEYPNVSVNIQETRPEFIFNALSQCDNNTLGLSAYADATRGSYMRSAEQYCFTIEPLYDDYFACFVSSQSPLAKRKKVNRKDLEPYPAVNFAAVCDEGADVDCDDKIAKFPFELYQAPNVIGVNTLESIKKLVCEDVGIAVLPKSTVFEDYYVQAGLMVPLEFEKNQILFHHCLILPKKYRMSKIEQAFMKELREIYGQMQL